MSAQSGASSGHRPLLVFVADDDAEMRRVIAAALRRDGHFVLEATDGAALLYEVSHAFHGSDAGPGAGVVISDVRMPGSGGLAILRALRRHPWCPPFIIMTAFGDALLHAEAEMLGARVVFDKPFELSRLRAVVRALDREQRGDAARS